MINMNTNTTAALAACQQSLNEAIIDINEKRLTTLSLSQKSKRTLTTHIEKLKLAVGIIQKGNISPKKASESLKTLQKKITNPSPTHQAYVKKINTTITSLINHLNSLPQPSNTSSSPKKTHQISSQTQHPSKRSSQKPPTKSIQQRSLKLPKYFSRSFPAKLKKIKLTEEEFKKVKTIFDDLKKNENASLNKKSCLLLDKQASLDESPRLKKIANLLAEECTLLLTGCKQKRSRHRPYTHPVTPVSKLVHAYKYNPSVKRFFEQLHRAGWKYIPIRGDGHCAFHTVLEWLKQKASSTQKTDFAIALNQLSRDYQEKAPQALKARIPKATFTKDIEELKKTFQGKRANRLHAIRALRTIAVYSVLVEQALPVELEPKQYIINLTSLSGAGSGFGGLQEIVALANFFDVPLCNAISTRYLTPLRTSLLKLKQAQTKLLQKQEAKPTRKRKTTPKEIADDIRAAIHHLKANGFRSSSALKYLQHAAQAIEEGNVEKTRKELFNANKTLEAFITANEAQNLFDQSKAIPITLSQDQIPRFNAISADIQEKILKTPNENTPELGERIIACHKKAANNVLDFPSYESACKKTEQVLKIHQKKDEITDCSQEKATLLFLNEIITLLENREKEIAQRVTVPAADPKKMYPIERDGHWDLLIPPGK